MLTLATIFKHKKTTIAFVLMSCVLYLWFAYGLERTESTKLVLLYTLLFLLAYQIIKTIGCFTSNKVFTNFRILAGTALLFRLLFLFAIPNLSQDFYRFIWDGQMLFEGFNPYLFTPNDIMNQSALKIPLADELYKGMGSLSASHFTNYPPLNQLCFVVANLYPSHSILSPVIGMRLIIIAADLGTLYFGKKLLEALKLPTTRIFWYILNPFIIIELTGNLHFEGVMIFFLVWSLYLLQSGKWKWAAVILGCSISVKLIPLMFLPLLFGWFTSTSASDHNNKLKKKSTVLTGIKKLILFYGIVGITLLLFFLPFFSMEFMTNYSETIALWFGNFEFNASVYYLIKELSYGITGYNDIRGIAKVLPIIVILIIFGFSVLRQNNSLPKLATSIVLVFASYLFLSTTVHPWYIASLVGICVFTNYRFPLVWSLVIVLSYLSYISIGTSDKSENLWIIGLEYLIVFFVFIWEMTQKRKLKF